MGGCVAGLLGGWLWRNGNYVFVIASKFGPNQVSNSYDAVVVLADDDVPIQKPYF